MNRIISQQELAANIKQLVVEAPAVAEKVRPGQFVVIILDEKGERIPLTVVNSQPRKGTLTLVFQEVGKTTLRLGRLKAGEALFGLLGPLGQPTEIKRLGLVITVGGGVGIAEVYPVTRAFKQAGNKVITIIGARTKALLILAQQLRRVCDELLISTDDGTFGQRGLTSDILKEIVTRGADLVYAVGPVPMMQAVAEITRPYKLKTLVCLNPIMVDATGMCGACRVSVGGQMKFGCVDGPEFDGHLVDFAQLKQRLSQFSGQEQEILQDALPKCDR